MMHSEEDNIPLCVDLDGTLLQTDSLLESLCRLLKTSPFSFFRAPFWWLLGGRAHFKRELARRVTLTSDSAPRNPAVLEFVKSSKAEGRRVILVTGADQSVGETFADGLFEEIIGSDGKNNLSGHGKAAYLVERYGEKGFDYVGNHRVDLPVWAVARKAYVVAGEKLIRQARAVADVAGVFEPPRAGSASLWAILRRTFRA